MPQRTVYIRDEDMELWMSLDRATLVRSALESVREQKAKGFGTTADMQRVTITDTLELTPKHTGLRPKGIPPLPAARPTNEQLEPPRYNIIRDVDSAVIAKAVTRDVADKHMDADLDGMLRMEQL